MHDTIYDDMCTSAVALVKSMFKENVNVSIVPQVQKQEGDVYCGLFIVTRFISWPIYLIFENKAMTPSHNPLIT